MVDELKNFFTTHRECEEGLGLWFGSIHVTILPSYQDMKTIALYLHKHDYSLVVKTKYTS